MSNEEEKKEEAKLDPEIERRIAVKNAIFEKWKGKILADKAYMG